MHFLSDMYDDPMWLAKDADCVGFLCGEYFSLVGGIGVLCGVSVRGQGEGRRRCRVASYAPFLLEIGSLRGDSGVEWRYDLLTPRISGGTGRESLNGESGVLFESGIVCEERKKGRQRGLGDVYALLASREKSGGVKTRYGYTKNRSEYKIFCSKVCWCVIVLDYSGRQLGREFW